MMVKSSTLMSGVPELVVLGLLSDREMYGYEIARALKLMTRDALNLGEGVLYPALHAMERRHLLRARSARVEGRTRIYYGITTRGKARLAHLSIEWQRVNAGVQAVLAGIGHD